MTKEYEKTYAPTTPKAQAIIDVVLKLASEINSAAKWKYKKIDATLNRVKILQGNIELLAEVRGKVKTEADLLRSMATENALQAQINEMLPALKGYLL